MTNIQRLMIGVAALALPASAASATTINLGTIDKSEMLSGMVSYTAGETVTFKFTVDKPYTFTFTDSFNYPNAPFPITGKAQGTYGSYKEYFGPYPVSGTLDYTLTTAPEPATWGMMLLGLGAIGLGIRGSARRTARTA